MFDFAKVGVTYEIMVVNRAAGHRTSQMGTCLGEDLEDTLRVLVDEEKDVAVCDDECCQTFHGAGAYRGFFVVAYESPIAADRFVKMAPSAERTSQSVEAALEQALLFAEQRQQAEFDATEVN
jgi:hypothetical protein